jgi:glycosyltransferase involved in cell wall biosynthesis
MRALHIGRALAQLGEVFVQVVSGDAGDAAAQEQTAAEFAVLPPIFPENHPNRSLASKLRRTVDARYLNLHGVLASASDYNHIVSIRSDFDLVWVLNARTPNILNQWHWPNAHLDLDNIPSTYLDAVSRNGIGAFERIKARLERKLMHRRELCWNERFTTLSVCSEADRQYLGGGKEIHVIPNGFERTLGEPQRNPAKAPPRIGFIGLCAYEPNRDGIRWFVNKCWPEIRRRIPGVRFRLAGKDAHTVIDPSSVPGVDVLGWVADPAAEIATWSAMVVPIRLGGGTRIKIADAFSRKCPVVSTRFGALGYDVENGRELLLADDPGEFADACVALIRDPGKGVPMAERAHAAFLEKWTWDAIAPKVWTAVEDCVERSRALTNRYCIR